MPEISTIKKEANCPKCGKRNNDNWFLELKGGRIVDGGCQDCWEKESDRKWWKVVKEFRQKAENIEDNYRKIAKFLLRHYNAWIVQDPNVDIADLVIKILMDRWDSKRDLVDLGGE